MLEEVWGRRGLGEMMLMERTGEVHTKKSRILAAGETCKLCTTLARGAGIVCWSSAGLVVERLRVRIPAEAEVEVSSPELPLCADSYSVSVTPPCYRSGTQKDPGHSAKSADGRLHLTTHTPLTQRSWSGLIMPLFGHSVGPYPETSSHTQLVRDHSATVVSAR